MAAKSDAKDAVLKYLTLQNRPYSANDITLNLHKEFGKTAIQKALDDLSSTARIKEKVYGKQKVYAPIQPEDIEDMDEVLRKVDVLIQETSTALAKNEMELKQLENELKGFANQASTYEAQQMEEQLKIEVDKLKERLEALQKTTVKVEPEEKKKITKDSEKFTTEYRKRKRICMDIANAILENYPKTKKVFFEEVGIETDEDANEKGNKENKDEYSKRMSDIQRRFGGKAKLKAVGAKTDEDSKPGPSSSKFVMPKLRRGARRPTHERVESEAVEESDADLMKGEFTSADEAEDAETIRTQQAPLTETSDDFDLVADPADAKAIHKGDKEGTPSAGNSYPALGVDRNQKIIPQKLSQEPDLKASFSENQTAAPPRLSQRQEIIMPEITQTIIPPRISQGQEVKNSFAGSLPQAAQRQSQGQEIRISNPEIPVFDSRLEQEPDYFVELSGTFVPQQQVNNFARLRSLQNDESPTFEQSSMQEQQTNLRSVSQSSKNVSALGLEQRIVPEQHVNNLYADLRSSQISRSLAPGGNYPIVSQIPSQTGSRQSRYSHSFGQSNLEEQQMNFRIASQSIQNAPEPGQLINLRSPEIGTRNSYLIANQIPGHHTPLNAPDPELRSSFRASLNNNFQIPATFVDEKDLIRFSSVEYQPPNAARGIFRASQSAESPDSVAFGLVDTHSTRPAPPQVLRNSREMAAPQGSDSRGSQTRASAVQAASRGGSIQVGVNGASWKMASGTLRASAVAHHMTDIPEEEESPDPSVQPPLRRSPKRSVARLSIQEKGMEASRSQPHDDNVDIEAEEEAVPTVAHQSTFKQSRKLSKRSRASRYMRLKEEAEPESPGTRRPSVILPALNQDEKIFHELVAEGDLPALRRFLADHPTLNINCVNYQKTSALHVALKGLHLDLAVFLLELPEVNACDAVLMAVKVGDIDQLNAILATLEVTRPMLEFRSCLNSPEFAAYVTPIMLAAQEGNFEMLELFLNRGHRMPKIHPPFCSCKTCLDELKKFDYLTYSKLKLSIYKAIASPKYIFQTSSDPILRAFDLTGELQKAAEMFPVFRSEYEELWKELRQFSADIVACCRDIKEVALLLKQPAGCEAAGLLSFPRLQLAIDLTQKEFVAHPNTQAVMQAAWVGEGMDWKVQSAVQQALSPVWRIPVLPFLFAASLCSASPDGPSIIRSYYSPVSKFISSQASHLVFLALLCCVTAEDKSDQKRGPPASFAKYPVMIFVCGNIWSTLRLMFVLGPKRFLSIGWSWNDMITEVLFVIAFFFWLVSWADMSVRHNDDTPRRYWTAYDPTLVGEGLFAIATILAYLRLFLPLSLNYHTGPLQISILKMGRDILLYVTIFAVVVLAFVIGMLHFYQPYDGMIQMDLDTRANTSQVSSFVSAKMTLKTFFWAIFGQTGIDSADVVISNIEGQDPGTLTINTHEFTEGVGYFVFGFYNFLATIVLMNMLTGNMANTFSKVTDNVAVEWIFARTKIYMLYIHHGVLPSPFNLFPTAKDLVTFFTYLSSFGRSNGKVSSQFSITHCCYMEREPDPNLEKHFGLLMSELVQRYLVMKEAEATED